MNTSSGGEQPELGGALVNSTRQKTIKRAIFAISISLNLLVLGVVLGAYFGGGGQKFKDRRASHEVMRMVGAGSLATAFERKDRRELSKLLREKIGKDANGRDVMKEDAEKMLTLLRADSLDVAGFERLFEAQMHHAAQRSNLVKQVFLQRLSTMTLVERQEFADRFAKRIATTGRREYKR